MDDQKPIIQEDAYLTVPEAARYLRVFESQLYAMSQPSELTHTRVIKMRVIIRMRDLNVWLATRTGLPARMS